VSTRAGAACARDAKCRRPAKNHDAFVSASETRSANNRNVRHHGETATVDARSLSARISRPPSRPAARAMASTGASLRGELTVYKNDPTLVMFTSGPEVSDSEGTAVFIGGLTDGPMSLSYLPALAAALEEKRWRLCQPTLSSAYLGFGVSDLDKDAEELDLVVDRILASASAIEKKKKKHAVALVGHSTGCQDIVHFLRRGRRRADIAAAVLQAPVSDREAMCMEHGEEAIAAANAAARAMCAEGAGVDLMPRSTPGTFGAPVSAARYASLSGRMTPDDLFSSDLTAHELSQQIGHMGHASAPPSLWVRSADDEYAPCSRREGGSARFDGLGEDELIRKLAAEPGAFEKAVARACGEHEKRAGERKWYQTLAIAQYGTGATANHALDGCGDWFAGEVASFVARKARDAP
jgi:pimeloyl-ACP methyl ester carboxylesterase